MIAIVFVIERAETLSKAALAKTSRPSRSAPSRLMYRSAPSLHGNEEIFSGVLMHVVSPYQMLW
jgi:hypothetical protein